MGKMADLGAAYDPANEARRREAYLAKRRREKPGYVAHMERLADGATTREALADVIESATSAERPHSGFRVNFSHSEYGPTALTCMTCGEKWSSGDGETMDEFRERHAHESDPG